MNNQLKLNITGNSKYAFYYAKMFVDKFCTNIRFALLKSLSLQL